MLKKNIYLFILLITIGFNLWLFFPETKIKSEVNDNVFQFGLIKRANEIWEEGGNLFDHWVPYWASGYPLPFYYSHLPQIMIVASYRLLRLVNPQLSLFNYFLWIKYLLLSFFPISIFFAFRILEFKKIQSAIASLFASQIMTNGLYGIDIASFLWRGYGLSSQLFAVFFAPLALSSIYRFVIKKERLASAVIFLFLTTAGHLGIGYMIFISSFFVPFEDFNLKLIKKRLKRLALLLSITLFFLLYWLVPFLKESDYHAVSFWDPAWKWSSYGFKEAISYLLSGEIFDFMRPVPLFSIFCAFGFFQVLIIKKRQLNYPRFLAFLFPFWFLLFWGRSTWGELIDLLPGMKEFHQHRFIVGIHLSALFLAPIGFLETYSFLKKKIESMLTNFAQKHAFSHKYLLVLSSISLITSSIFVFIFLCKPVFRYTKDNTLWLQQGNKQFAEEEKDFQDLISYLKKFPDIRIHAINSFLGKDFEVGNTPVHMQLSISGFAINGFLPETWSPNSDNEFFFDPQREDHYHLYNIGFIVVPEGYILPKFAQLEKKFGKFHLYKVKTGGYFDIITTNLLVESKKTEFVNIVHLWQQSDLVAKKVHPFLTFKTSQPPFSNLPQIKMKDEVTYEVNGQEKNIFAENPLYLAPTASPSGRIIEENGSSVIVKVGSDCQNCLLVYKTTFHPNWQVFLDGKKVKEKLMVFPAYLAIQVPPGKHQVVFSYQPSKLKIFLMVLDIIVLLVILGKLVYKVSRRFHV